MDGLSYRGRIDLVGIELECLFLFLLVREERCSVSHGEFRDWRLFQMLELD